jgi:L-alanine-DL-glutamate epimerase-like enolase superfamily enzyme
MKITRLRIEIAHIPLPKPIPSNKLVIRSADCVLAFLETNEGLTGEGLIFALNNRRIAVLHEMVRSLEPLVVGLDLRMSGAFWPAAWSDVAFFGHKGISIIGIAAIDDALWDLRAKAAGLNVSALIGASRPSVPVYASGSLRLSASIDELQAEATTFLHRGFRAIKMSLGKPDPAEDARRVRAVREAVGPQVSLMADANQQLTVERAIRLGRMLEEYALFWMEEPVPYTDHAGEAAIAAALDTAIASGESEYTRHGMLEMLRLKSADILMPDLQRMGGPTEFIKVAHLAEAFNTPISPHLFSEMSLALAAALPNVVFLEYMPWFAPLYRESLDIDAEGRAAVPDRAGWGFSFDAAAVKRFADPI